MIGKPYPIFDAVAIDDTDNSFEPEVKVYLRSGDLMYDVNIDNGVFYPTALGKYDLVYTAKDSFGNVSSKVLTVNVKETSEPVELALKSDVAESAFVGELFTVPEISAVTGGVGELRSQLIVKDPAGTEQEIFGHEYVFEREGNYTLVYRITDFLGQVTEFPYAVSAQYNVKPIISEVALPSVVMSGARLNVNVPEAVLYTAEKTEKVPVNTQIWIDGTEFTLAEDGVFIPETQNASAEMVIRFSAGTGENIAEREYPVTIVNPFYEDLDISKYFYAENFSEIVSDENSIRYYSDTDSAKLTFIKELMIDNFNFSFDIPEGYGNFDKLQITLKDSVDYSQKIVIGIRKGVQGSGKSFFSINGGEEMLMAGSFYGDSNYIFQLTYSPTYKRFSDAALTGLTTIATYENGTEFAGFSSHRVLMEIEMLGVQQESAIEMIRLNGQVMNNINYDKVSPNSYVVGGIPSSLMLGDTLRIGDIVSDDVLCANTEIYIEIEAGGETILERQLFTDAISLKIEKSDLHFIYLTAIDEMGNQTTMDYSLRIVNKEKPVIKVNGSIKEKAKVGQTIDIPDMTVESSSPNITKYIFYITPNDNMELITDGKFTPETKGVYIIRYFVFDEFYNYAMVDYEITVS